MQMIFFVTTRLLLKQIQFITNANALVYYFLPPASGNCRNTPLSAEQRAYIATLFATP